MLIRCAVHRRQFRRNIATRKRPHYSLTEHIKMFAKHRTGANEPPKICIGQIIIKSCNFILPVPDKQNAHNDWRQCTLRTTVREGPNIHTYGHLCVASSKITSTEIQQTCTEPHNDDDNDAVARHRRRDHRTVVRVSSCSPMRAQCAAGRLNTMRNRADVSILVKARARIFIQGMLQRKCTHDKCADERTRLEYRAATQQPTAIGG